MATYTLGRVGIVAKGEYSSTTAYAALDMVSYQGISYIAKVAATGVVPTNTTYWMQAVQGGDASTSDATAYAADLLSGKTAYARGAKITGTIGNYSGSYSVTPSTSEQTLATAGKYLSGNITVSAATGGGNTYSYVQLANGTSYSGGSNVTFACGNLKPKAAFGYTRFATGAYRHFFWADFLGRGYAQGSNDAQGDRVCSVNEAAPYQFTIMPNGSPGALWLWVVGQV